MEMRDGDDYTTAIVLVLLLLAATGGAVALTFVKQTRAVCLEARAGWRQQHPHEWAKPFNSEIAHAHAGVSCP